MSDARLSEHRKSREHRRSILKPVRMKRGDKYRTITIRGDGIADEGYPDGCVFIVKQGALTIGGLHYFKTADDENVCGYVTKTYADNFHVRSIDFRLPSGWHSSKRIELVGCVAEWYPFGIAGVRMVVWDAPRTVSDLADPEAISDEAATVTQMSEWLASRPRQPRKSRKRRKVIEGRARTHSTN